MKRYFMRVREHPEEGTLFGSLDHWVEIRASTLIWSRILWFIAGGATTFLTLAWIGGIIG